jgi:hypothetical protein
VECLTTAAAAQSVQPGFFSYWDRLSTDDAHGAVIQETRLRRPPTMPPPAIPRPARAAHLARAGPADENTQPGVRRAGSADAEWSLRAADAKTQLLDALQSDDFDMGEIEGAATL